MIDGFSPAGWSGEEMGLYERFLKDGFEELYYYAPYHWGVINIEKNEIFTYTEGDTTLYRCGNTKQLLKEAESHYAFFKEEREDNHGIGEEKFVIAKIKKKMGVKG